MKRGGQGRVSVLGPGADRDGTEFRRGNEIRLDPFLEIEMLQRT